jgi:hypothetical protein
LTTALATAFLEENCVILRDGNENEIKGSSETTIN